MTGTLVPTRLFRIGRPLALTRPGTRWPDAGPPAVLVIPRGGPLCEPRLMVLGDGPPHCVPGPLDFADVHVTAVHTGRPRRRTTDAAQVADVLLDGSAGPPGRLGALLERYPGCNVAAGAGPRGHAAAIRAAGDGFKLFTTSGHYEAPWAAIAGSFLYGWTAAGLAADELCHAVLIIGALAVPGRSGAGDLLVAGRVRLRASGLIDGGSAS
jgi:hypothetical protein